MADKFVEEAEINKNLNSKNKMRSKTCNKNQFLYNIPVKQTGVIIKFEDADI